MHTPNTETMLDFKDHAWIQIQAHNTGSCRAEIFFYNQIGAELSDILIGIHI